MVREILNRVIEGGSLHSSETAALMHRMMDEELTHVQLAALLVALRAKGETADEVVGFARTMRERARHIDAPGEVADTCGTGGDGRGTFNISTAAALIVAGAGQPVAKHGNRAASGSCGSADVLESLGVDVALPPEGVSRCIEEAGIGFLFAPAFHPAMKFAATARRELGVRTVFNLLGPLTNPAKPAYQLIGVSSSALLDLVAQALLQLEIKSAMVVHSEDGMDEISIAGETQARLVQDGSVRVLTITADDFGIDAGSAEGVRGGDAATNSRILLAILDGKPGPARDVAVINAAAALFVAGRASSLREGAALAEEVLSSGAAMKTLVALRTTSHAARAAAGNAA